MYLECNWSSVQLGKAVEFLPPQHWGTPVASWKKVGKWKMPMWKREETSQIPALCSSLSPFDLCGKLAVLRGSRQSPSLELTTHPLHIPISKTYKVTRPLQMLSVYIFLYIYCFGFLLYYWPVFEISTSSLACFWNNIIHGFMSKDSCSSITFLKQPICCR